MICRRKKNSWFLFTLFSLIQNDGSGARVSAVHRQALFASISFRGMCAFVNKYCMLYGLANPISLVCAPFVSFEMTTSLSTAEINSSTLGINLKKSIRCSHRTTEFGSIAVNATIRLACQEKNKYKFAYRMMWTRIFAVRVEITWYERRGIASDFLSVSTTEKEKTSLSLRFEPNDRMQWIMSEFTWNATWRRTLILATALIARRYYSEQILNRDNTQHVDFEKTIFASGCDHLHRV